MAQVPVTVVRREKPPVAENPKSAIARRLARCNVAIRHSTTSAILLLEGDVVRPNSTYELVIKTAMGRGAAIPKGRINLPREAKMKTQDRVFVFAEGRQADEAKRAGAEFVGGTELIDAVWLAESSLYSLYHDLTHACW